MRARRRFAELEKALGVKFADEELIEQALTHGSARARSAGKGKGASGADYERLEFVGDRVLGLAIAELLNAAHPDCSEGELARRFNQLVRGATCAAVARQIGLGKALILGGSEADSGGRDKETILADAMEAVLGAIFLDHGYNKARDAVHRLWGAHEAGQAKAVVDAKSALQEWAQGQGLALPAYTERSRVGPDHAPKFVTEVRIKGLAPAEGEGASKRAAEQAAAAAMLAREGVWKEEAKSS